MYTIAMHHEHDNYLRSLQLVKLALFGSGPDQWLLQLDLQVDPISGTALLAQFTWIMQALRMMIT